MHFADHTGCCTHMRGLLFCNELILKRPIDALFSDVKTRPLNVGPLMHALNILISKVCARKYIQ